jgi:hypothetical protein
VRRVFAFAAGWKQGHWIPRVRDEVLAKPRAVREKKPAVRRVSFEAAKEAEALDPGSRCARPDEVLAKPRAVRAGQNVT